jgi:hypothetical protein
MLPHNKNDLKKVNSLLTLLEDLSVSLPLRPKAEFLYSI